MMMNIKAVFFDVDGTLLSFDTHRVSKATSEALRQLHKSNIKIIIATGRAFIDLRELVDIPYDAVAALNGADCLLRDGTPIARRPISLADFLEVKAIAEKYDFPLAIETNEGIFINQVNSAVVDLAKLVDHPVPVVVDIERHFRNCEYCQLCIYCDETIEKQVMRNLPGLNISRWNPHFADVNVRGVDKSVAVDVFCRHYAIKPSEVMAFGDGGNDIPMLRVAGIGIAMGDARDVVKNAADYVTKSVDEQGVSEALSHFGVIKR